MELYLLILGVILTDTSNLIERDYNSLQMQVIWNCEELTSHTYSDTSISHAYPEKIT